MSTKEQDFKERLAAVLRDLNEEGVKDPEAVWLIGSMAGRLMDLYKLQDWRSFKRRLSAPVYDRLLKDFAEQGNAFHKDGKPKAAYAIQALATSVVCVTQRDAQVKQGERLLDQFIETAVTVYRKSQATMAARAN